MEVVINDTNIFIDLYNIGLLDKFKFLSLDLRTIDFVVREIKDEEQRKKVEKLIDDGYIHEETVSGKDMLEVFRLYQEYQKDTNLSRADCACMQYAEKHKCRLLTGDKTLRTCSAKRGITVSGVLYPMCMMVDEGIVVATDMITYLKRLVESNPRSPKKEIKELIEKFSI